MTKFLVMTVKYSDDKKTNIKKTNKKGFYKLPVTNHGDVKHSIRNIVIP